MKTILIEDTCSCGSMDLDFNSEKHTYKCLTCGKEADYYLFKRELSLSEVWNSRENGQELIYKETLHFGNGLYCYREDAKKAGIHYRIGYNTVFAHIDSESQLMKFVEWLDKNE